MSKGSFAKFTKSLQATLRKHSPEILVGVGIAGMITTTILAVRATPKAMALIEEKKKEDGVEKLPVVDTVKTTWKCYLPSAIVGGTSIACLIGASSVNLRRNAALATAYAISESTLKDYQNKVVSEIGEKKEKTIREAIAKDKIDQHPIVNNEIIVTEKGNTRCFDLASGRYFLSDIDILKKAANELNRRMRSEMYISLNEYYTEIGLEDIPIGHDIGWNIDKYYIDLEFSPHLASDGQPCLAVGFEHPPVYNFR